MKPFGYLIDGLGAAAAMLFFVAGIVTSYEVVARYFFNAPTYWSLEISQLCLIWGVFIGLPAVFRHRRLITVEMIVDKLEPQARRLVEYLILILVFAVASLLFYVSLHTASETFLEGRRTASLLALPSALFEIPVTIGMGLLALQALVDFGRLLGGAPVAGSSHHLED